MFILFLEKYVKVIIKLSSIKYTYILEKNFERRVNENTISRRMRNDIICPTVNKEFVFIFLS